MKTITPTRVLLFRPRFVAPIREGTKVQTMRHWSPRNREIKRGDLLSLRHWSGKAYRSPQAEIVPPVRCTGVVPVRFEVEYFANVVRVWLGGDGLTPAEVLDFVRADGFGRVSDFAAYHQANGTTEFEGVVIGWEVTP